MNEERKKIVNMADEYKGDAGHFVILENRLI
jgi:hypothetical protein